MRTRYSEDFIAARKQALLDQKTGLEADLAKIAEFDESSGQYLPLQPDYDAGSVEDQVDDGAEAESLQERAARVSDLAQTLDEVNLALSKIEQNTYGRCEETGEWINEDRLIAYPAAKTCR